jgi:hypothetical protein
MNKEEKSARISVMQMSDWLGAILPHGCHRLAFKPVKTINAHSVSTRKEGPMIDRVFSARTGSVFLSGWFLIFCLSASAIDGGDYHPDNAENTPVYSQKDDSWIVNALTVITLAPGIYFIPEVGYYYMDNITGKEQGYQGYVGVKWQIDF